MAIEESLNLVAKLSEIFGASEPAFRLLLSLLASYPIALGHRFFLYGKNGNVQHLYFVLCGLVIGYFNYGTDVIHSAIAIAFTYATIIIFGASAVSVGIVFIFNMVYLLTGYYYVGTNEYDINWTLPHCVLVLRLIGLAFDIFDGRQPYDSLPAENKKVALAKTPTFLEVLGHMFFPASYLVGPQFPMKRYQDFVQGKFGDSDNHTEPPDCIQPAVIRFSLGVLYLTIYQTIGVYVSDAYLLSDEYREVGFINRCLLLGVWGKLTFCKYISCWLLAEGACIMFGLTHNGKDENEVTQWNGLANVKLSLIENSKEFSGYVSSFNINTNHWVAQYVYKRLRFLGNRYISQGSALLFLAVWHGFHSGYYVCFALEFLILFVERDVKELLKSSPSLSTFLTQPHLSIIVFVLLRLYTFVFMGWCLVPFAFLTYDRYWRVFSAVNYVGFLMFGLYPILYGPLLRKVFVKKAPREHAE